MYFFDERNLKESRKFNQIAENKVAQIEPG